MSFVTLVIGFAIGCAAGHYEEQILAAWRKVKSVLVKPKTPPQ